MGRHRVIDREAMLDAAERVVLRDGAAKLSLDAVATEAGISKASVLYDYKTKQALIRALVERRVAAETARMGSLIGEQGACPDAVVRGRLAAARQTIPDGERAVAISLCAALAQGAALREPIRAVINAHLTTLGCGSTHPRGALLAFLAIEGLMFLERFGFHAWPRAERDRILGDIAWLITQEPAGDADPDTGHRPVASDTDD
jgi:AcrR family transcriptional regulator